MACQRNENDKVPRKDRAGLTSTVTDGEVTDEPAAPPAPVPATEGTGSSPEAPAAKPVETGTFPEPAKPVETGTFPEPPKPVETGTFPQPPKPVETGTFPEPAKPTEPVAPTTPVGTLPDGQKSQTPTVDKQSFFESVKEEISTQPVAVEKAVLPDGGTIPFDVKTGQPAFAYSRLLKIRFPKTFNRGIAHDKLSARDQEKWIKIFAELRKASNFRDPEQAKYLFIDQKTANKASISYEKDGSISLFGAWTIAVGATAVRYDFVDRPCAEFVSEMVRQAYKRAGYALGEDFNKQRGNKLIHESSHAVRGLSKALDKAGWIPWDASKYRPPVGAPAMHESGLTPGHTYLAAGDNGLWIVDNSKPRGRDLRKTDPDYVRMMYKTGLFFLPPGLNPLPWEKAD